MSKTAILLLGAGESKRLGEPKQLLPYKDTTLLGHTLEQLKDLPRSQIFVVVGAHFSEIFSELRGKPFKVIKNNDWNAGVGSSISKGIQFIQKQGGYDKVLITLCDLPLLDAEHYNSLVGTFEVNSKRIVLSEYDTHDGVPAVFCKSLFNELSQLKDDDGAKPVVKKYKKEVIKFASKTPYFDVDTQDAYQKLLNLS